jgi:hypothetical protein
MAPLIWTSDDLSQMRDRGTDPKEAERQLRLFQEPPSPIRLIRPATLNDGIRGLSETEKQRALERFDEALPGGRFQKFVPASGAASRMFQALNKELLTPPVLRSGLERRAAQGDKDCSKILEMIEAFPGLAFAGQLANVLTGQGLNLLGLLEAEDVTPILRGLLGPEGLDYARKPKGLIPFHPGSAPVRDAFWEQLVEAEGTLLEGPGEYRIHFTVPPEFMEEFRSRAREAASFFGAKGIHPQIGFSVQKPSTDTLAVDMENRPFRDEKGCLLFRPGGHGALIANLNDLGADLVFIKNIDNVATGNSFSRTLLWKSVLGGVLLEAEQDLKERRNRPIRVCGVVPNTGEPGGGPFWVAGPQGETLQIVESSQVDMNDEGQKRIFQSATHFNPVDLVCSVRREDGTPFDLREYVDPKAVFFSRKSYQGRNLKALELPGLWNGAMAHWTTIFVEVPLETFNPVKTVFDLLKPAHR